MKTKVTIRTLSMILILTMLLSACLTGCSTPLQEEIIPEETEIVPEEIPEITQAPVHEEIKAGYIPKNVPLYDQRKYTRIPFGVCSVASDGCGITCAAMVISYFTEFEIMPDYLGRNYNLIGKTNEQRMIQALHDFNIEVVERYYGKKEWPMVYEALEEGHLVISLQGTGLFTTKEHFILLTGLTEDGKITVNDPYGLNYKKSRELRSGFKNGFDDYQIWRNGGHYYVLEFTGAFIPFGIQPSPYSHTTISSI